MSKKLTPQHIVYSTIQYEDGTHDSGNDYDVYDKEEVDAVLAEKDEEIRKLRKALYQAVFTVCKYDTTFQAYYTKKRNQGKSYRCAQGHCVRKLIRVIYKLLSTDSSFNSELIH